MTLKRPVTAPIYCLPIIRDTTDAVIAEMCAAPSAYSLIEIWLDYLVDLNRHTLEAIEKNSAGRDLLYLFRRQNLETVTLPLEKHVEILNALPPSPRIDFDIATQEDDITHCRKVRSDARLVLSYHNYQETPASADLHAYAAAMRMKGAEICKFSTFCRSEDDALRLMCFLRELKRAGTRCVVLGMGEQGILTRIIGPMLGSEIAYAPQDVAKSSAPGQLTLSQLQNIFRELSIS